jgi:hypothetical protein
VGPNDHGGCVGILSVIFVVAFLIAPPLLLYIFERSHYETFTALQEMIHKGITPFSSNSIPGDIVHLTTPIDNNNNNNNSRHGQNNRDGDGAADTVGASQSSQVVTSDPDMGVHVAGALSIDRQVEFCQWQQMSRQDCQTCTRTVKAKDGSTSEESYECNCVTSYSYYKTWFPYLISSFMFDQPGAHHNPQRNPLPASKFYIDKPLEVSVVEEQYNYDDHKHTQASGSKPATTSTTAKVMLPPSLFHNLQLPKRKINWVRGGVPNPPGFFAKLFSRIRGVDTTRYDPLQELAGTESSKASLEHQFVYVGEGGYFFSPYESTNYGKLLNLFVQYMEGSLLDWQLGDLMPSCTAGDIRIHYQVQDPSEISVLAQVSQRPLGVGVDVGVGLQLKMYTSDETSTNIALVQEGDRSVSEMIHAAVQASSRSTWIFRALLVLWSVAIAKLLGAYLGLDVSKSTWAVTLSAPASVASGTLGATWMVVWGASSQFAWDIGLCLMACVALGALVLQHATKGNVPGSWNAVWCMIGRWAKVPPEWRQENAYIKHEPVPTQEEPHQQPMDESIPFHPKEKTKSL